MIDFIRTKLNQFLCKHEDVTTVDQVTTELKVPSATGDKMVFSKLLYFRRRYNCNDCGKKNIYVMYSDNDTAL